MNVTRTNGVIDIPLGWRKVNQGEILAKGDRWIVSQGDNSWDIINSYVGENLSNTNPRSTFIREIPVSTGEINIKAKDENDIPAGWTKLGPNRKIERGDYYFNPNLKHWQDCLLWDNNESTDSNGRYVNGKFAVIRQTNPLTVGEKAMFAYGSTVKVTAWINKIRGSRYYIKTDAFKDGGFDVDSMTLWCDRSCLTKIQPPIKVGDYTVEEKEKGVQVGCTFVSDETIAAIAKLRKLT